MPKKKLVVIGHTYAVTHNRSKMAALSKFFEVTCIVPDFSGQIFMGQPFEEFNSSEEPYGQHKTVILPLGGKVGKRTMETLKGLKEVLSNEKPDIILVEAEPWSFVRWQTWWLARRACPQARFYEFSWENLLRPGLRGCLLSLVYRAAVATNSGVISGNQAAALIFEKYGQDHKSILVNAQVGISAEQPSLATLEEKAAWRRKVGIPEDAFVVGFCGRIVWQKGVLLLVRAALAMAADYPRLRICLVGHGELADQCRQEVGEMGVCLPPVTHEEVGDIQRNWDLTALPSQKQANKDGLWEEQFGRVIIESVAMGVPVIGSRHGAIPEVLGVVEAVFEEGLVESLEAKMRECMESNDYLKSLYEAEKTHVFSRYTHSELAASYANFLSRGLE